jgi:hypothetical protein
MPTTRHTGHGLPRSPQADPVGVGTRLVRLLLRRAVLHGAHTVIMDIQAENRRVLRAVRRAFPDGVTSRDVAVLTFQAPIRRSRQ